jgi:hypothetical protein
MRRYSVARRVPIVSRLLAAIEKSGCRVLAAPDPKSAPFELRIETGSGETVDLVCYAFTANTYRQRGRPLDEHRFQIKYGGSFHEYHEIFVDSTRRKVTLMMGVHVDREVFVAIDPRMHSPTWFSTSVEFKAAELDEAETKGWHGWQRERSLVRRKAPPPQASLETEVLVAFRPEFFGRYIEFERLASGLDCGERLLFSDQVEKGIITGSPLIYTGGPHPLELQLGLPAHLILDVVSGAFRLAAAVRGGVAEYHLEQHLRSVRGVDRVRHITEDGKPDFEIRYKKRDFRVECKNVLARRQRGLPRVDFQKTRAAKSDPCSRYYKASQFEVLAACLHPVTQKWEFQFSPTAALPSHRQCPERLASNVLVATSWPTDLRAVLDSL